MTTQHSRNQMTMDKQQRFLKIIAILKEENNELRETLRNSKHENYKLREKLHHHGKAINIIKSSMNYKPREHVRKHSATRHKISSNHQNVTKNKALFSDTNRHKYTKNTQLRENKRSNPNKSPVR